MIVRQRGNHFILTDQHQHGLMSGVFAENLEQTIRPWEETLYAISYHDVGWVKLDKQILWNEEKNQPYSFMDYPLVSKLEAYAEGISQLEANSIYAGYLCSKQCTHFLDKSDGPIVEQFLEKEQIRRQRMRKYLSQEEKQYLLDNFRLLRFCDDLSLSLCLNEPGEQTHPWYQNGIQYNGKKYQWIFDDVDKIRLMPNVFRDSFTIQLPYTRIGDDRQVIEEGTYRWNVVV